ncbi:MAG: hypothetical protein SFU87_07210 [Chitinophagaceae bacterium]|nr:hypothetical protein [Chitinophagaceae bacterium]
MKWAKTIKELDDENPDPRERAECFEEYDEIEIQIDTKTGKKLAICYRGGKPYRQLSEWVTHLDLPRMGRIGKRKYEVFCGGFLYFYDEELVNYPDKIAREYSIKFPGDEFDPVHIEKLKKFFAKINIGVPHEVYFHWYKENDRLAVTVFIDPPAGNPDPPTVPPPPPPETIG